jgi:hypothetical protein
LDHGKGIRPLRYTDVYAQRRKLVFKTFGSAC